MLYCYPQPQYGFHSLDKSKVLYRVHKRVNGKKIVMGRLRTSQQKEPLVGERWEPACISEEPGLYIYTVLQGALQVASVWLESPAQLLCSGLVVGDLPEPSPDRSRVVS